MVQTNAAVDCEDAIAYYAGDGPPKDMEGSIYIDDDFKCKAIYAVDSKPPPDEENVFQVDGYLYVTGDIYMHFSDQ